jgi:hypothetical protein
MTLSTGAKESNQHRSEQSGGGNLVGKAPSGVLYTPPDFQGKSGQSDNQDTNRGPGGK